MYQLQKFEPIVPQNNYPLPNMEHLLQKVIGSGMMSMLDGFLS